MSTLRMNVEFDLPGGSYSASDIQDYFEYVIKDIDKRLTNIPKNIRKNKNIHK